MKTLKLGVIGATGFADRTAIPEFAKSRQVDIVAVQGRDEERVRNTARHHSIDRWTTDVDEVMSDDDVDAVYIASPVFLHARETIAAARAGKHVLCEKPMALTSAECAEMIEACEEASVFLMPAFMMRFNRAHMEMKRIVDSGAIGQVVTVRAQFGFWYPQHPEAWRQVKKLSGGGALADVGSHCIDLVRYLIGDITSVVAHTPTAVFDYDVDDVSTLMVRFDEGAIGFIDVYFNTRRVENRLEIVGTEGTIISEGTIAGRSHSRFEVLRPHRVDTYDLPHESPYVGEVEHFVACIAGDTEPRLTGYDGLVCQQIMEAAQRSDETGAVVTLSSPITFQL